MDEILWHEDFRRCLLTYHENEETGASWEAVTYGAADHKLYLCPEADDLLYRKTSGQERIVDFSDDHQKSREIFFQLIREAELPQVNWQGAPYYWRYKSSNGLNLRPGLLEGRPDLPVAVTLGDDAVHGLIVGRTGSGKSVLLNNLLVSLMDEYAPWELNLYIVDMKKVEFGAFMSKGQEAAHVKACAATGEVRYIISLLETLERVMQMRQNFFTAIGCKKLSDFRRENPTLALPRILVVVDEFQQLFLNAAGRERDDILRLISSITRLGRATGFHLLFASQEMSGTGVGGLLGNFKLRMALPCDAPVSSEILGNSAAAELDRGWVLVNCAGGDETKNQRFRVPFVDAAKPGRDNAQMEDQYLQGHLSFVRQLARQTGFLRTQAQKYYQEDLQFDISLLENRILPKIESARAAKLQEKGKYLDVFALGSTVLYSAARVDLENVCVERGRGQNIMAIAPDPDDLVYLQKLMVDNLASSPRLHQAGGLELDFFSFDPVMASYYPVQEDSFLEAAGLKPRLRGESDLPLLIQELQVRKLLFRYLSAPDHLLPLTSYFERASLELLQALENCQARERDRQIPRFDTAALRPLRENLLKELSDLPEEDLERFIASREVTADDVPVTADKPGGLTASSAAAAARSAPVSFRTRPTTPQPVTPPAPVPPSPAALARAREGLELFMTLLRHYARCRTGTAIQDQLPLRAVMMSNTNMSDLLSATSPRRDIRVLQEELVPQATTFQTLFFYFMSEAGSPTLRSGFNYFFVCGNREKDYTYCRMRYTNKAPGSIVVDCRIHSKNVERSFKKFRWLHAKPSADALDLSGIQDLYDNEENLPPEETEDILPPIRQEDLRPNPPSKEATAPPQPDLDFF